MTQIQEGDFLISLMTDHYLQIGHVLNIDCNIVTVEYQDNTIQTTKWQLEKFSKKILLNNYI